MKDIPCKDCKTRSDTCHSHCELYKAWQVQHEKEKTRQYEQTVGGSLADAFLRQRSKDRTRNWRRQGNKVK